MFITAKLAEIKQSRVPAPLSPNARFDAPRWQPRVTALWKASWPHLGPPPSSSFLHHSTAFSRLQVEVANPRSFFFFSFRSASLTFTDWAAIEKAAHLDFVTSAGVVGIFEFSFSFFWIFANERRSITTREWLKVILTKNSYQTVSVCRTSFYFFAKDWRRRKDWSIPKGIVRMIRMEWKRSKGEASGSRREWIGVGGWVREKVRVEATPWFDGVWRA